MGENVSEFILRRLHEEWDVERIYGEVGVCMATSGPSAIHLLNGLYDAKLDHQPVVAIAGQQKTMSLGANYQQEIDLQVLFKDVASEFCVQVSSPSAARHIVDRAFRVAHSSRTVACIIVPADIQEQEYSDRPFVFDAMTDPNVPPLPPHIRMEQAKKMGMALIGGEDDAAGIVRQAVKGKWQELVNH